MWVAGKDAPQGFSKILTSKLDLDLTTAMSAIQKALGDMFPEETWTQDRGYIIYIVGAPIVLWIDSHPLPILSIVVSVMLGLLMGIVVYIITQQVSSS
jgi:hypothetical protein